MRKKARETKKSEILNIIYLKLKELIYSGYLKSNETLNLQALAKNFETSVTPINSVISLLAREGLVIKHPNKSSVVPPMSTEEVKDIWLQGAFLKVWHHTLPHRK